MEGGGGHADIVWRSRECRQAGVPAFTWSYLHARPLITPSVQTPVCLSIVYGGWWPTG